jgi:DNA-binding SARP family transcriptional activator/predicted ATPase
MSMPRLEISILGPFQASLDGKPLTGFAYDKVRALLAILAVESHSPQSREALASLLWPEDVPNAARASLRKALSTLRNVIGDKDAARPTLLITRDSVQFDKTVDYWLDVEAFSEHLEACQCHPHLRLEDCEVCLNDLEAAIGLYRGDFLQGLIVGDSLTFEEWVLTRRERYRSQLMTALHYLTNCYISKGKYGRAQNHALKQVEMEPYREEAHRALMLVLSRSGQRSAALAQYEACKRILIEELGVEPTHETQSLYIRIRQSGESRPHNLPPQLNPLIGREGELIAISERLANPDCRLLTLTGTGGIGKTSLALGAARENLGAFWDGVYFIPLGALTRAEQVLTAIIGALPLSLAGPAPPFNQLSNYLRGKTILLVLDNMEQLLEAGRQINALLEAAPDLKILVTSRERLNLRAEWVYALNGLPYPKETANLDPDTLLSYAAVQFFIRCAKRGGGFGTATGNGSRAIARICKMLQGTPLAIELAAAWTGIHSVEEIETQVRDSLDFLATSMVDVQPRHRSLRATFEHSWDLLTEGEQSALGQLSTFQGGFNRRAAREVARTSRDVLEALRDKSLLQAQGVDRYELHPLVRQFAAEKLAAEPSRKYESQQHHCDFYMNFLERQAKAYHQEKRRVILDEIHAEIDNLRAAWTWAIDQEGWSDINRGQEGLYDFYDAYGWYQEGFEAFDGVLGSLRSQEPNTVTDRDLIMGRLLARQGRFSTLLGRQEEAKEALQESVDLLVSVSDRALPLSYLGVLAQMRGEYQEATRYAEESLAISVSIGRREGQAFCLNLLGNIALSQGDLDRAREMHLENLSICQEIGDHLGAAIARNNLGNIAHAQGYLGDAQKLYHESYASFSELNHRLGMAATLSNAGYMAAKLGDYDFAKEHYQKSLSIKRDLGHQAGIATTLTNLGETATTLGELDQAAAYFKEALSLAMSVQAVPLVLEVLVCYAVLLIEQGEVGVVIELLSLSQTHPASRHETRQRAEELLEGLEAGGLTDVFASAQARGQALKLEAVVEEILGGI